MAKKTSTRWQPATDTRHPTYEITVGFDGGYGVTKISAVGRDDQIMQPIKFPSIIGPAHELDFRPEELTDRYPGEQLTDEDGSKWFVGDVCMTQLRPEEQMSLRGRGINEWEFRKRLLKVALGKLMPGLRAGELVKVHLSTGLPVSHMADATTMAEALSGVFSVVTDQSHFSVVIDAADTIIMPQPYGTYYAYRMTATGELNPYFTQKRVGIVDAGMYTVDAAFDDNGEFVDAMSGSVEAGVHLAYTRLSKALERQYRQKFSFKTLERAIREKRINIAGQDQDITTQVNQALETMRASSFNLVSGLWQEGKEIELILLSGGPAPLIRDVICEHYPQTQVGDQVTNSLGYLYYALFLQNHRQDV